MQSRIPKAKYTVGDVALVIVRGETLEDSYHYFGTIVQVAFIPDPSNPPELLDPAALPSLKDGQVPILYCLGDLSPPFRNTLEYDRELLWEQEIAGITPNR